MVHAVRIVTIGVLLLMGILAGFFFSFSFVVMPGLDQTDPVSAIEAMQGINRAVRNPVFFVPFFLTPVFGAFGAILAWVANQRQGAFLIAGATVVYLAGAFVLTVTYHVPMNEALALVNARAADINVRDVWATYSSGWTPGNTFRTLVCLSAMVPLILATIRLGNQPTMD